MTFGILISELMQKPVKKDTCSRNQRIGCRMFGCLSPPFGMTKMALWSGLQETMTQAYSMLDSVSNELACFRAKGALKWHTGLELFTKHGLTKQNCY